MASERQTIRVTADVSELKGLFKALNAMDREANIGIKDDVMSISRWVAEDIKRAASTHVWGKQDSAAQALLVADTVRATRDRLPTVTIGGSKRAPIRRATSFSSPAPTVGEILFGNEFGGDRNAFGNLNAFPNGGYRFPKRTDRLGRGNEGYWIFPTVRRLQPRITAEWVAIIRRVENLWSK